MAETRTGGGTKDSPWKLKTPSEQSAYQAYRDETLDPAALVVNVGKTELRYHLRCITGLHAMLKARSRLNPSIVLVGGPLTPEDGMVPSLAPPN